MHVGVGGHFFHMVVLSNSNDATFFSSSLLVFVEKARIFYSETEHVLVMESVSPFSCLDRLRFWEYTGGEGGSICSCVVYSGGGGGDSFLDKTTKLKNRSSS